MATVEREVADRLDPDWKSPLRKLVKFFWRSRDGWKAKYRKMRQQCRRMANQVRAVEKSRAKWREAAEQAQQEVRQLRMEMEEHKKSPA